MDKQFTKQQIVELNNWIRRNTVWCADGVCRSPHVINLPNLNKQVQNLNAQVRTINNTVGSFLTQVGKTMNSLENNTIWCADGVCRIPESLDLELNGISFTIPPKEQMTKLLNIMINKMIDFKDNKITIQELRYKLISTMESLGKIATYHGISEDELNKFSNDFFMNHKDIEKLKDLNIPQPNIVNLLPFDSKLEKRISQLERKIYNSDIEHS